LERTAAAPQAVPDVGQWGLDVSQVEVNDPGGPGRRALGDHVMAGEIAVDDHLLGGQPASPGEITG
jgi:hypothetical protein